MRQLIITSCLFLLFSACKGIMQVGRQQVSIKNAETELILEKNSPLVALEVDGVPAYFLFDTGATATVLTDSTIVPGFSDKEFGYIGKLTGADGKKQKNKIVVCEVKSPIFESPNKALIFLNFPPSSCQSAKKSFSGILGMDLFFRDSLSLQLDFTSNKIRNLTKAQADSITGTTGYFQVRSECESKKVFIFLTIEGKEFKFKLDTGFSGNIIIPYKEEITFSATDKIELDGSLYRTVTSQTKGKEIFYENMPVTIGNDTVLSEVSISGSITAQNIGISFIKCFDWVIDIENNRVFIRKNENTGTRILPDGFSCYAKENNGKLLILVKEQSQSYALGDEILSVNGVAVTSENACDMQNLVNKTADWSTLKLEMSSVSN